MTNDVTRALEQAGIPIDQISDLERNVLAQLSEEELRCLLSIRQRFADADNSNDVTGFLFRAPQPIQGSLVLHPAPGQILRTPAAESGDVNGGALF
jgi:hypothetical protein